ncbi:keratin, type II cytoskeletal 1 [Drosophila hydei]|uniref:Keratin, type II cytoskeletal 1 n=1 Tax=Drosophila hydei TaxID=7224 RepID=A0A6J1LWY4_DROHY|nr:keratin, type II cytoskeletal 1 [Drosophila hydei]
MKVRGHKLLLLLGIGSVLLLQTTTAGKVKLFAFKGPHAGFVGLKVRTPKLLGLKHALSGHGGGFGGGIGGGIGFGGGFGGGHSGGYHHEEYHHESHYSSGGSYGGGGFGGGLWGK